MAGYSPASVASGAHNDPYWDQQIQDTIQTSYPQIGLGRLGDYNKQVAAKVAQAKEVKPTIASTAERNLILSREASASITNIEDALFGPNASDGLVDVYTSASNIPIEPSLNDTKRELEAITSRLEAILRKLGGR